jgi:hypothetical protein
MKLSASFVVISALFLTGCASVDMADKAASLKAKEFSAPAQGKAGLYVYRDSHFGAALKKDVWVDGKCLGETAPNVFFYTEVEGGKMHKVDTESEFSPNTLELVLEAGKHHFIRQYIKLGVFVGGAGVELIAEEQGKKDIAKLDMAKPGKCS